MSNHAIRHVLLPGVLLIAGLVGPAEAAPSTASCQLQAGFSPEGSAAQLVDDVLDSAHTSVHLAAYTFTSPDVVRRVIAAKRRGVDVAVIADAKENTGDRGMRAGQAALDRLVQARIAVRTVSTYQDLHDKYIVVDGETLETGSYNYSTAAARRNSENAVVMTHCPSMAGAYEAHWQSRWSQGKPYETPY